MLTSTFKAYLYMCGESLAVLVVPPLLDGCRQWLWRTWRRQSSPLLYCFGRRTRSFCNCGAGSTSLHPPLHDQLVGLRSCGVGSSHLGMCLKKYLIPPFSNQPVDLWLTTANRGNAHFICLPYDYSRRFHCARGMHHRPVRAERSFQAVKVRVA